MSDRADGVPMPSDDPPEDLEKARLQGRTRDLEQQLGSRSEFLALIVIEGIDILRQKAAAGDQQSGQALMLLAQALAPALAGLQKPPTIYRI